MADSILVFLRSGTISAACLTDHLQNSDSENPDEPPPVYQESIKTPWHRHSEAPGRALGPSGRAFRNLKDGEVSADGSSLVARDAGVHVHGPGVDASAEAFQSFETCVVTQKLECAHRANADVAEKDHLSFEG